MHQLGNYRMSKINDTGSGFMLVGCDDCLLWSEFEEEESRPVGLASVKLSLVSHETVDKSVQPNGKQGKRRCVNSLIEIELDMRI